MKALLVLALLCWAAGGASAQTCRFPSFQSILANQPGLTIITQIVKTLEATNPAAVPAPADGVTFLAPTDAAFIALLSNSGLSTAVAQRTLAAKGVSILEYHLLSGGGYTPAQLLKAVTVQTNLGKSLDASLPLTFGAGTAANTVTASGVANEGTLSAATPVCTSTLYVINSVLLPARTLATVPTVAAAAAPASAPALAPALGPVADVATSPEGAAIAAAPKSAPVATTAPGLAPAEAPLAPAAAPGLVPAPAVAVAPSPTTAQAPSTTASAPSGSTSPPLSFALAPSTATPTQGAAAGAGASAAAMLACSAAAAMVLLAAL